MEYALFFDQKQGLLLVRFGNVLTQEAFMSMRAAVENFVKRYGRSDGILDLSAVETVHMSARFLKDAARAKPILLGNRRVWVAKDDLVFGLGRMFELTQGAEFGDPLRVVRTLEEAYALLEIEEPDFRPVPPAVASQNQSGA
jgi:hypothetical protein